MSQIRCKYAVICNGICANIKYLIKMNFDWIFSYETQIREPKNLFTINVWCSDERRYVCSKVLEPAREPALKINAFSPSD